ncbi:MAG: hypothetical protein AB7Q81_19110 [Gammaproteobacteria bacterium]
MKRSLVTLAGSLAVLYATQSFAAVAMPGFSMRVMETGTATMMQFQPGDLALSDLDGDDVWQTMNNGLTNDAGMWSYGWNLEVDPDPFIAGSFTMTNHSAVTQNYTVLFGLTLPAPLAGPFTQSGKLDLFVFDGTPVAADGSLSATVAAPNTGGYVNGSLFAGLLDGDATLPFPTAAFGACSGVGGLPSCGVLTGPFSAPYPGSAAAVVDAIGIRIDFGLSAHDQATFVTRYTLTPVPLPAPLVLLGSAMALLAVRRPRRAT